MIFWQTFLQSFKLPNKQTIFKLNRTGMDIAVIYMFILLFLVSTPSLIERLTENTGLGSDMNLVFVIIYFFMFYYLPLTIIVFVLMTVLSYGMTWVASFMKRKIHLQILWKMCAYTLTIPLLLYTVIALFFTVPSLYFWAIMLYTIVMLVSIIAVYPKRKEK